MTTLYRPVQVTNFDQLDELPPGSFMHPDCRNGGILTYLVPIEAEEEHKGLPVFPRPADAPWPPDSTPNQDTDGRWYYIDEDGYSTAHLGDHPFHDLMVAWIDSLPRVTRYTTPWEPQQ